MPTSSQRFLTGLVGENILVSRSPWLHEQEGDCLGVRLIYSLFDFAASGRAEKDLPILIRSAIEMGFSGLNVTHPFKQSVIPLLDELSPTVKMIGAVNTIKFDGGRAIGHNTDVGGFAESLRRDLPDAKLGRVVQYGAGGAGAATAHALLGMGVEQLLIVEPEADRLARTIDGLQAIYEPSRIAPARDADGALKAADGVVNATPIGMASYPGTPFDPGLLDGRQWVADIIYFPTETELLRKAQARGCATMNGSAMVVFQAAESFEIFTGLSADRERMMRSFSAYPEPARKVA